MKYFSAFSGIGGFEVAVPKNWECVGYSEILPQAITIYSKHFPKHKNYGDISKIIADELPDFDLFVGGFPCQDLSIAGKREGLSGSRSGLFYEIVRILKIKRPTYLLLENVRHLLSIGKGEAFQTILWKISELGYDCEWALFYSADFGKPQSRSRVYILGTLREKSYPCLDVGRAEEKRTRETSNPYKAIIGDRGFNGRIDVGKRIKQKTPILFKCKKRFRSENYNWEEIGRVSTRIIRNYAGIPIRMDGRDTENLA